MSEEQVGPVDPHAELADRLRQPPEELGARAALLDETVGQLQTALTALDEV
ncbi:MAG TPA: hypothetical protein VIJ71_04340 [Mycobacteriales bacterium]